MLFQFSKFGLLRREQLFLLDLVQCEFLDFSEEL